MALPRKLLKGLTPTAERSNTTSGEKGPDSEALPATTRSGVAPRQAAGRGAAEAGRGAAPRSAALPRALNECLVEGSGSVAIAQLQLQ